MRIGVIAGFFAAIAFFATCGNVRAESAASTPTVLAALRQAMLGRPIGSLTSIHTVGTVELLPMRPMSLAPTGRLRSENIRVLLVPSVIARRV